MAIKIFIDPGHNPQGVNAGAEGFGLREQDITFNVSMMLAEMLRNDPRFDVRLSRNTPTEVLGYDNSSSLIQRVNAANNWGADFFISIHCNANENPLVNGTEVYVLKPASKAYYFGEKILLSIVDYVGTKNNGMKTGHNFYVLRKTYMPAVLVELAYISNREDAYKLENNQDDFAYAIYMGILDYFGFTEM